MEATVVWTIYCHVHVESGRRYVGLTGRTWKERWRGHVSASKHVHTYFAHAIRKYGKDAFSHEVLETCGTLEEANVAEEKWILHFDTRNPEKGFNLAKGGFYTPCQHRKNPWEQEGFREKVTASIKVVWQDPEHQARMSASSREVNSRPEVKKKIGDAARGRVMSPETRQLISAQKTGRTGRKTSEATKKKLAAANVGKTVSDETRARMSAASSARRPSEETRARISATAKARFASVVRTHCKRGHELLTENVYMNSRGVRECRTCKRLVLGR